MYYYRTQSITWEIPVEKKKSRGGELDSKENMPGVVVRSFSPSTQETEAGNSMSLKPA